MPLGQEELLTAGPLLAADVLRDHAQLRLRAHGGSMFPAIRSGDILEIRQCAADAVQRGDVVLRLEEGRLFAHRVMNTFVDDGESFVVTRGDSHWRCDPAWSASRLLGRVTEVTRDGRTRKTPLHPTRAERAYGLADSVSTQLWRRAKALFGA